MRMPDSHDPMLDSSSFPTARVSASTVAAVLSVAC